MDYKGQIITLRGRDYDKQPRKIVLTSETEQAWYGWPLANSKCPVLEWPKFVWQLIKHLESQVPILEGAARVRIRQEQTGHAQ